MNVPKLRFKEFTDEWTHCFLSDIAVIQSGLTPSRKIKEYYINGIIPWIKTTDLNNSYITKIEEKISKKALDETSIKIFPKNTLLLAMYGGYNQIGRTGLSTTEITTNQALSAILFKNANMNSYFFLNLLNKYKDYWKIVSASSRKDPNITKKDIERFPITYPTLKEQNKIAKFLSTVDKKISNLEDIITTLEKQKKGLLQKIFNQKLRFKDENGKNYPDWISSTIGKSGDFYYGKSAPKWSITDTATTPCVRYGELYTTHKIIVKKIYSYTNIPKENLKFSTGNEVLVPRVGEEPLDFCKCCYLPFKDVAIGEMISVYNTKNNPLFISYMFNATMKYKFARLVEGGNVSNLYYSYLKNIKIELPCLEEQTKIADFLSAFDRKIDNQKAQLEHWKQIKKGLLQQMFV